MSPISAGEKVAAKLEFDKAVTTAEEIVGDLKAMYEANEDALASADSEHAKELIDSMSTLLDRIDTAEQGLEELQYLKKTISEYYAADEAQNKADAARRAIIRKLQIAIEDM